MKAVSWSRRPEWNEKKVFFCGKCGKVFMEVKILFCPKCPRCGSRNVKEDNQVQY